MKQAEIQSYRHQNPERPNVPLPARDRTALAQVTKAVPSKPSPEYISPSRTSSSSISQPQVQSQSITLTRSYSPAVRNVTPQEQQSSPQQNLPAAQPSNIPQPSSQPLQRHVGRSSPPPRRQAPLGTRIGNSITSFSRKTARAGAPAARQFANFGRQPSRKVTRHSQPAFLTQRNATIIPRNRFVYPSSSSLSLGPRRLPPRKGGGRSPLRSGKFPSSPSVRPNISRSLRPPNFSPPSFRPSSSSTVPAFMSNRDPTDTLFGSQQTRPILKYDHPNNPFAKFRLDI